MLSAIHYVQSFCTVILIFIQKGNNYVSLLISVSEDKYLLCSNKGQSYTMQIINTRQVGENYLVQL